MRFWLAALAALLSGSGAALFTADVTTGSLVGYVGLVVSATTFGYGLALRRSGSPAVAYTFMLGGLVATAGSLIVADPAYAVGSVGCWLGYVAGMVLGGFVVMPTVTERTQ